MGEARLSLVRTYLGLTVQAPLAPATAAHERCGDPVPDRPSTYVGAHGGNYADQLVAWNVREMYPVVVPGPCMPVTATKTGTVHLHDDAPRRWCRIGNRPDIHRTTELLEDNSAHEAKSAGRSAETPVRVPTPVR
jgi:hypothetical protein